MAVTEQAMCLEWVIILSVLLMDTTVLVHTSQQLQSLDTHTTFPEDTGTRLTDGIKALSVWATNSWYADTSVPEKLHCMLAVVSLSLSLAPQPWLSPVPSLTLSASPRVAATA